MKKAGLVAGLLVLIAVSAMGQEFSFPVVTNDVRPVQNAFLALLRNIDHMGERSVMDNGLQSDNNHDLYVTYLDFILNNMGYDHVRSYFFEIKSSVEQIDYQGLSRSQQRNFEYFLETARVDSWTFGIGGGNWTFNDFPPSLVSLLQERKISEDDYREALHKDINNYYRWVDFFDGKNNMIRELLVLTNVRDHLVKIIDDEIPQRALPEYERKLNVFLESWGLQGEVLTGGTG
jgi:hypothetical protein